MAIALSTAKRTALIVLYISLTLMITACISQQLVGQSLRDAPPSTCPQLEGNYRELGKYHVGQTGRFCGLLGEKLCDLLTYNLLSRGSASLVAPGLGPQFGQHKTAEPVEHLQITDGQDGTLEILLMPMGKRVTLSMKTGDFTCTKDGLLLKTATNTIVSLFNGVSEESRVFNVAGDGSLIVDVQVHNYGVHLFVIPVSIWTGGSGRWERIPARATTESKPVERSKSPDQRPTGDSVNCVSDGKRQWIDSSKCD